MLLKMAVLEGIRAGRIDLAYRQWRRPTVRAGGSLRTAIGILAIEAVEPCTIEEITVEDAVRAGYGALADLLVELDRGKGGRIFRIRFRLAGEDPRQALRAQTDFGPGEMLQVLARLAQMDRSRGNTWTGPVLRSIGDGEGVPAAELALRLGIARDRLKRDIRRLKEMGLTESLERGYRLSPRGRRVLAALRE